MGQVYRARDTRLDRIVAIKVLPEHIASDREARQRLEREARAVSSLNHPHICTLFDVGRHGDTDFFVMEYLEGQTLAQKLAGRPLSMTEALSLAVQVAGALDKAHRAGIIHRDLKPGNIMLVRHGRAQHAKLLDFGLAKAQPALAGAGATGSLFPTVAPGLTAQGMILGTLQYMAPEQLEGREADTRTDMFAFGAVLYEMVTGRKAFEGKSHASLIAAILEHEPSAMATLQPVTPVALDHIVSRCLAKDPDDRWQSASDVAKELEWVSRDEAAPVSVPATAAHGATRARLAWTVAASAGFAAILALVVAMTGWLGGGVANTPRVARLAFARPAGTTLTNTGRPIIAMSPDGTKVVFVADYQLYVRDLESNEAQPIPGTALGQVHQPFFSPDGQ
jgi:serine/threonine protein kinase